MFEYFYTLLSTKMSFFLSAKLDAILVRVKWVKNFQETKAIAIT